MGDTDSGTNYIGFVEASQTHSGDDEYQHRLQTFFIQGQLWPLRLLSTGWSLYDTIPPQLPIILDPFLRFHRCGYRKF